MRCCQILFLSHGCGLAEGHPPELGHVCLTPDYDALPYQHDDNDHRVTFSLMCYRVEADDERCTT